ncbi:MAG: MoaD/ThiS family protein [Nitrospirae bacterium]|nr:MAG: MoaD/ThiS family protein [Nitrospirota bacterium]
MKYTEITLNALTDGCFHLYHLMQEGVGVVIGSGSTLWGFLTKELGLKDEFLDRLVKTVLVNGRPADRPEEVTLNDGDRVALSSAMPGLVGTTLIKGSPLSSFRTEISYRASNSNKPPEKPIMVTFKLFSLVMKELSPCFLERGVLVDGKRLSEAIRSLKEEGALLSVHWEGKKTEPDELLRELKGEGLYMLRALFKG